MRLSRFKINRRNAFAGIALIALWEIVLFGLAGHDANAFTVLGPKWQNPSATYKIDASYTNQHSGWNSSMSSAVSGWNGTGLFTYSNNSGSSNHIKADEDLGPINLAGTRRDIPGSYITGFTLIVNVYHGWAFYDGTQGASIPPNYYDLKSILRHELGHALGLCHSHISANLLYPTFLAAQTKLVDSDAYNGANWLYHSGTASSEGGCY